jgi:hypothetical protein
VEGLAPESFFRAWAELDQLLPPGVRLDLVSLEDVSPELRARILEEVKMPDDPVLALKSLVEDELRTLERVVDRVREALESLSERPTQLEVRGLASYLHDFYTGVESIFERIAVRIDGGLPKSAQWHIDLLDQMAEAREGVRPAVIDTRLWGLLKEYLEFRHFLRHAYGYELSWLKMRPLAEGMADIFAQLDRGLREFFRALAEP